MLMFLVVVARTLKVADRWKIKTCRGSLRSRRRSLKAFESCASSDALSNSSYKNSAHGVASFTLSLNDAKTLLTNTPPRMNSAETDVFRAICDMRTCVCGERGCVKDGVEISRQANLFTPHTDSNGAMTGGIRVSSAPIASGWSTTNRSRPCVLGSAMRARSLASSSGSALLYRRLAIPIECDGVMLLSV